MAYQRIDLKIRTAAQMLRLLFVRRSRRDMFQRIIDDFKDSTGTALRLTSLAVMAAFALLITTAFLCAATFVAVLQRYGLIEACLTGAGIFMIVTLIAAGSYMLRQRQIRARAQEAAREAAESAKSAA